MYILCYLDIIISTAILLSTALLAPVVSISPASGSPTAGQTYSLTCSVQVVALLVVEPSIEWTREDGAVLNASSGSSLQLNFNPLILAFTHAGLVLMFHTLYQLPERPLF